MARDTDHPRACRRQQGHIAGAVVFGLVLTGVMTGGYLWLQGRREVVSAKHTSTDNGVAPSAVDKWTRLLGRFLAKGPDSGVWETQFLSCVYKHHLAPHPTKKDLVLIAQENDDGKLKAPRAVSRWLVPRHFFRAPAALFFSNYTRSRAPVLKELDGGAKAWRVLWKPRSTFDGFVDTERRVWFSPDTMEVLQIEDRSRDGRLVRRLRRKPAASRMAQFDLASIDHRELEPPDPDADPDLVLDAVVAKAPFPVFIPRYLPPGFVLVRSSYTVFQPETPAGAKSARVQLVSQLYSDGLALVSVGIAPRGDMNVIERVSAGMSTDPSDPAACPGLPLEPRDIRQNDGSKIRLRTDTCRTVVRRDDLDGVSVTLIGRNELPGDEYLRMIGSLTRRE